MEIGDKPEEIGSDTESLQLASASLRQDPDVILVGEMRDLETITTAIQAAETGHLVLATLHTNDCTQTVDRIIDVFPPYQQQQVRVQLSLARGDNLPAAPAHKGSLFSSRGSRGAGHESAIET